MEVPQAMGRDAGQRQPLALTAHMPGYSPIGERLAAIAGEYQRPATVGQAIGSLLA